MFSAGAGVFFPEPEFFFAGAGSGGEKPGVCTALTQKEREGQNDDVGGFTFLHHVLPVLSFLSQRQPEQCRNCMALEETLRVKLKELRSKDDSIAELLHHGQKMAKQLSKQVGELSFHTIPYHIIPYHIIPYHIISYHTIACYTMPYHTIPYHAISYHAMPCHVIPYPAMLYHTILYHTMKGCFPLSRFSQARVRA